MIRRLAMYGSAAVSTKISSYFKEQANGVKSRHIFHLEDMDWIGRVGKTQKIADPSD